MSSGSLAAPGPAGINAGLLAGGQQLTRPLGVLAHRDDEVVDRVELVLAADAGDEIQRDVLPVQVGLGVQDERLDGAGAPGKVGLVPTDTAAW